MKVKNNRRTFFNMQFSNIAQPDTLYKQKTVTTEDLIEKLNKL